METTIVDASFDCRNDTSVDDVKQNRGKKSKPRAEEAGGIQKSKLAKSKAPRRNSESRLDPSVEEMRPEIASVSGADARESEFETRIGNTSARGRTSSLNTRSSDGRSVAN
ncbi:unnamed protein product [Lasius platythorax]|uniref:Uncharacterized protein n=1 Tax=Lasius platythorax TaxID=488582 RepID=A0AAV2MXV4_9HYME